MSSYYRYSDQEAHDFARKLLWYYEGIAQGDGIGGGKNNIAFMQLWIELMEAPEIQAHDACALWAMTQEPLFHDGTAWEEVQFYFKKWSRKRFGAFWERVSYRAVNAPSI